MQFLVTLLCEFKLPYMSYLLIYVSVYVHFNVMTYAIYSYMP